MLNEEAHIFFAGNYESLYGLAHEDQRISTFYRKKDELMVSRFPNIRDITPEVLASNGFYYYGVSRNVKCAFCPFIIKRWTMQDNASNLPRKHKQSRVCPMVLKTDCPNIPFSLCRRLRNFFVKHVLHEVNSYINTTHTKGENVPRYLDCCSIYKNNEWSVEFISQAEAAGFAGLKICKEFISDCLVCPTCCIGFRGLDQTVNPLFLHAAYSPNCPVITKNWVVDRVITYCTEIIDLDLVNSISTNDLTLEGCCRKKLLNLGFLTHMVDGAIAYQLYHNSCKFYNFLQYYNMCHDSRKLLKFIHNHSMPLQIQYPSSVVINKMTPKETKIAHLMCKICGKNKISVLFTPCYHMLVCQLCSLKVTSCFECKEPIGLVCNVSIGVLYPSIRLRTVSEDPHSTEPLNMTIKPPTLKRLLVSNKNEDTLKKIRIENVTSINSYNTKFMELADEATRALINLSNGESSSPSTEVETPENTIQTETGVFIKDAIPSTSTAELDIRIKEEPLTQDDDNIIIGIEGEEITDENATIECQ